MYFVEVTRHLLDASKGEAEKEREPRSGGKRARRREERQEGGDGGKERGPGGRRNPGTGGGTFSKDSKNNQKTKNKSKLKTFSDN